MLRPLLHLAIVISIACSANGLLGFSRGKSLIFREPPFADLTLSNRAVELKTITQRVDNFNPQNNATFEMRYYENAEFFQPGSPIFIYVGGEWTISPGSLMSGGMYDIAKEWNGIMYYTEHRYYGRSYPTPDASTENLRFLTIDQALADLAHFIIEKKTLPGLENSPVIVVGGSYSATMVAWFRQKYPHLAVGAWASSAPLHAKLDFVEYKEIVGAAIRHVGGEKCHRFIVNAFAEGEQLIADGRFDDFRNVFGLCAPFDAANQLDVWNAFSEFTDIWAGSVQYHSNGLIERTCSEMMSFASENSTDLETFALWIKSLYNVRAECIEMSYNEMVEFYRQTEWGSSATAGAGKQWFYQTCSEFGWYQTSGSRHQPFGSSFPIELYFEFCKDLFGFTVDHMEELIAHTNVIYGGFHPAVENVYFTHGQVDPWRAMGVQTDLNEFSPAVVIEGASHCQDLSSLNPRDNAEMRAAKLRIKALVKQWIEAE